jgi:hypothetical protein
MTDKVTPERIAIFAAAARVPIPDGSSARIAKAVSPTVARMSTENIQLQLEIEPAAFVTIARKGAKR